MLPKAHEERKDFGAIETIKEFIASKYAQRYSKIWDEFIKMSQSEYNGEKALKETKLSFSKKAA
jgi:hypothetical protein